MEHVQHAPPLPQTMSGQHALHHPPSDIAGLPQRPSGSEARRKAALSLNARLALIDKQVLQHVIPQRQQSASLLEDQDIAQQVIECPEC